MPLRQLFPDPEGEHSNGLQVDIIAVHGLNPRSKPDDQHAWNTWRKPDGNEGRLWLRDDLPKDTSLARIFLYEYNSKLIYGGNKGQFSDQANDLLEGIFIERMEAQDMNRPLIFIAHSLGGLLVEQALVNAHNNPRYLSIQNSTFGIVFFGTPHYGGNKTLVQLGSITASIAMSLGLTDNNIIETLQEGSLFNDMLREQWRHQLESYKIVSFWEGIGNIVSKESATFGLGGNRENIVRLNANHSDMCRFGSSITDSDNFKIVRANVLELYMDALKSRTVVSKKPEPEEYKCMRSLYDSTSTYEEDLKRNEDRVSGTCEWFIEHERYKFWKQDLDASLLWVSADPGCGKSFLVSFLVDKLCDSDAQSKQATKVCYFFFKDDNDKQKTASSALCAILHQIFKARTSLIKHAMTEFLPKGRSFTGEFTTLWAILSKAAADPDCGKVICIIDALDECEEVTRTELIRSLVMFHSKPGNRKGNKPFLKFIVTSRPYLSIEKAFHGLPNIRLKAEDETDSISGDIGLVVKCRVRRLASRMQFEDPSKIVSLEEDLINKADRTFLWVSLILEMLEESIERSEEDFTEILNNLPRSLDVVYEKTLARSPDPETAKIILQIITAAVRPLSLMEMNTVLSIQPGQSRSNEDLKPKKIRHDVASSVKELCGLFVRVRDSKFYLVHQTAKEYLTNDSMETFPNIALEGWKHSLNTLESNFVLAERCMSYILFDEFENHPLVMDPEIYHFFGNEIIEQVHRYTSGHDFLDYAAEHWAIHFHAAQVHNQMSLLELALKVSDTRSKRYLTWFQVFWTMTRSYPRRPLDFTDLMVGAYFGHHTVVRRLLNEGADVEAKCNSGETALHWAVRNRYLTVVRLLLENGSDVNAKDENGRTALFDVEDIAILEVLLEKSPDINTRDCHMSTPLHNAVDRPDMLQLLLESKAVVDAEDEYGVTALHSAVMTGNVESVRLLLKYGADVDVEMSIGASYDPVYPQTNLQQAAESGYVEIVRLLLKENVDFDAENDAGLTALHMAAFHGHLEVARLLVNQGADVNARTNPKDQSYWLEDRTVLFFAASNGSVEMVQLLLDAGANADEENKFNKTALHEASQEGHSDVVHLLLEHEAAVDAEDDEGSTALTLAVEGGHDAVVQLLLKKGADPNVTEHDDKRTLLQRAAEKGQETVVTELLAWGARDTASDNWLSITQLYNAAANGREVRVRELLKNGLNPDTKDSCGKTALSRAAENGQAKVVEVLLQNGANIDMQDRMGYTALHNAAGEGHVEVVRLLLEKGANIEAKTTTSNNGSTALHQASWWKGGQGAVVQLLLEGGADIEAKNDKGRTPLYTACWFNYVDVVRRLLDAGARLEEMNNIGETALHIAAKNWEETVVRLLLEKGANIEAKTKDGETAIHRAAERGSSEVIKLLLDYGADMEVKSKDKMTALSIAAKKGDVMTVRLLLRRGADIEAKTANGKTALDWATAKKHKEVVQLLVEKGATLKCTPRTKRRRIE